MPLADMCHMFPALQPYCTRQEHRGAAGGPVLWVFCALNPTHTAGIPKCRWRTCAICFLRLEPYRTRQEQRGAAGGHELYVFCALNPTHAAGTTRCRWRTCAVRFLRLNPFPHGRNNAVPLADMCCVLSAP